MGVTAIVPVKALPHAKSRLAGHLDEAQRRALVIWMLGRVLDACLGARPIDRVLAVVGDLQAAAVAARPGVDVVIEPSPGLRVALETADRAASKAHATLVIPADLPLATAADLETICGVSDPVIVVPTRDGGTGAFGRRPPDVVGTAFGPASAAAHLRLAAAAGVRATRMNLPNLALDVDTPGDLRLLRDRVGCRTLGADRTSGRWH
ncbi:MAG: 2-phospho-L-lactate guanylyltransferase [Egibacteraceae bacterium]